MKKTRYSSTASYKIDCELTSKYKKKENKFNHPIAPTILGNVYVGNPLFLILCDVNWRPIGTVLTEWSSFFTWRNVVPPLKNTLNNFQVKMTHGNDILGRNGSKQLLVCANEKESTEPNISIGPPWMDLLINLAMEKIMYVYEKEFENTGTFFKIPFHFTIPGNEWTWSNQV